MRLRGLNEIERTDVITPAWYEQIEGIEGD